MWINHFLFRFAMVRIFLSGDSEGKVDLLADTVQKQTDKGGGADIIQHLIITFFSRKFIKGRES